MYTAELSQGDRVPLMFRSLKSSLNSPPPPPLHGPEEEDKNRALAHKLPWKWRVYAYGERR